MKVVVRRRPVLPDTLGQTGGEVAGSGWRVMMTSWLELLAVHQRTP